MNVKYELQNIISRIGHHTEKNLIEAAAYFIRESQKTSGNTENEQLSKEQEAKKLISWINKNQLWFTEHDEDRFIANGAEQRVFLHTDERFVYKLNDSIFYANWLDYFYSLLVHNFFFPSTSYELIGFYQKDELLFAVVKQLFIEITESTNTDNIKLFLNENGFHLKKNNDYYNPAIGIILEDLHEENVLTKTEYYFLLIQYFIYKNPFSKNN
jgi:hypothetical protein